MSEVLQTYGPFVVVVIMVIVLLVWQELDQRKIEKRTQKRGEDATSRR